jgi:hypothetical protein
MGQIGAGCCLPLVEPSFSVRVLIGARRIAIYSSTVLRCGLWHETHIAKTQGVSECLRSTVQRIHIRRSIMFYDLALRQLREWAARVLDEYEGKGTGVDA